MLKSLLASQELSPAFLGAAMFALFMGTTLARLQPSPTILRALPSPSRTLRGIRSWSSFLATPTPTSSGVIPSQTQEKLTPGGTPMPQVVHRVLGHKDVKSRVIVIGDIHGCYDELRDLLDACKYTPEQDTVVLVGDLVNKGPKSAQVVEFARKSGFHVVRGNHDDAALEAYFRVGRYQKSRPPAYDYVTSLSEEDVEWLNELPYTISLPTLNALIVHAGLIPNLPLPQQRAADLSKLRNVIAKDGGSYDGREGIKEGDAWVKHWKGPQHVYFGHDARRGLQLADFATGLDTGCCYGRSLTAAILPSRERIQVPARTAYVQVPKGDD